MSEMVERVASLLSRQLGTVIIEPEYWDALRQESKEVYRRRAVEVLNAIREPTDQMVKAFYKLDYPGDPTPARAGWSAMIDAAIDG